MNSRKVLSPATGSPSGLKSFFSPASALKASSPVQALLHASSPVSPASQYELQSKIGEGGYGKVHKARDLRTQQMVAIKTSKVIASDREVGGVSYTVLREIKLMQAVRHPNVMSYEEVFADGGELSLVMEFMEGDLKKVIEDKLMTLTESHVKCLSSQILAGLAALHSRYFLHRDVTPANILLDFRRGVAKLADFGQSRSIGQERPLTPRCGVLEYRAPELLFGAKFYGASVDIWSAGCIVAELFLRSPLFQTSRPGDIPSLTKIFEIRGTPTEASWRDASALPTFFLPCAECDPEPLSNVLPSASVHAHAVVDNLLCLDPKQRPSAEDSLQQEFFTSALPLACRPCQLPFVRQAMVGNKSMGGA